MDKTETKPKGYKKHIVILGVLLVALAVGGIAFQKYVNSLQPPISFVWDTSDSRKEIDTLGVNSGGLRAAYGYVMDPNANVFTYTNESVGCSVAVNFGTTAIDESQSELGLTDQRLISRLDAQSGGLGIIDKSIRYNYGSTLVPVRVSKAVENAETGAFTAYVSRVFKQEEKALLVEFTCLDLSSMDQELEKVLDGIVMVPEATSF